MPTRIEEYQCECGESFEHLFHNEEPQETMECPSCHAIAKVNNACTQGIQAIVRGNADFGVREKERLTKRSNDHWKKQGRGEARERVREKIKQGKLS